MSSQSVSLPEIPAGKELEEFVSAFYQVSGMYIERNIVQRETEEVLEVDILSTDYNVSPPSIKLIEVKSGNWGFPDLFKLRGWLDYLNLEKAVFVASKERANVDFFREKASLLNIDLKLIPDLSLSDEVLVAPSRLEAFDANDISMWRFSYWLERTLMNDLTEKKKIAHKQNPVREKRYDALALYLFQVNSGAFFEQTISERMKLLCDAYKNNPNLTAKTAAEIEGEGFDEEHERISDDLFKRTFYKCEYNDLQLATMIEYKSRLALLKHAVDFILYSDAGNFDVAQDKRYLKILGHEYELSSFDDLPQSFKDGINVIREQPYFHRYPIFWQWFMWLYGGFVLSEKQEIEFEHMATRTGIPVEEIANALNAFDILFPTPNGWLIDTSPNSNVKLLRMFPVPYLGLGAHYRQSLYGEIDYSEFPVSGPHTLDDLIAWNNAAVSVLSR